MKDLALDRSPLEHRPLRRLELVEAGGEQRLEVGGTATSPLALAAIASISVMKAGCRPRRRAIRSRRSPAIGARDELVDVVRPPSGSSRSCDRPVPAALAQIGSRHAEEQDRRTRREQRDLLDEVEEGLLAPLDVVEDAHERRACSSSSFRKAQAISSADVPSLALAEQGSKRGRSGRVRRQGVELLQHLDDRPVGDPFAVGEAAARTTRASISVRSSAISRDFRHRRPRQR